MTISPAIRKTVPKLAEKLQLVVAGGYMMLWYLELTDTDIYHRFRYLGFGMLGVLLALNTLVPALQDNPVPASDADLSPRVSGVAVVVVTGLAIAYMIHHLVPSPAALAGDVVTVIVTAVVAAVVWRFATRHANAIGEARFQTKG